MNRHHLLIPMFLAALTVTGCDTPKTEPQAVSFSRDILPIFSAYCVECHQPGGEGLAASGLNLESYDNIMKGTKFGPIITPGSSVSSTLVVLVEGRADKSLKMPHGERKPLAPETIALIRNWIDQGAKKN